MKTNQVAWIFARAKAKPGTKNLFIDSNGAYEIVYRFRDPLPEFKQEFEVEEE